MRSENQTRIIQGDSMDENNRNIRVVKTGGRKVTKLQLNMIEQVREKNLERT